MIIFIILFAILFIGLCLTVLIPLIVGTVVEKKNKEEYENKLKKLEEEKDKLKDYTYEIRKEMLEKEYNDNKNSCSYNTYCGEEISIGVGFVSGCIVMIGLIICSIISIVAHVPARNNNCKVDYLTNVKRLENNKEFLLSQQPEYDFKWHEMVTNHNKEVQELSMDVRKKQLELKDPWINWFVEPVYKEFNVETIDECYINKV